MDNLIERLQRSIPPQEGGWGGNIEYIFALQKEAAAALADAQATIARLEAALQRIADWDLPPSGRFYPNADGSDSDRPAPYDSVYGWGSEGGKKAVRDIARAALAQGKAEGV